MMHGIDISSHQTGINLSKVPCDFVIIKATQGTSYINPDLQRAYKQALTNCKCIGLYHYASQGGSNAEAKHFIDTVNKLGAVGRSILVLDWEQGDNHNWGNIPYAKGFLDYILARTGVTPFIYMSKIQGCRSFDWSSVAPVYPLWRAQYKNYTKTGYQTNPWTDKKGDGAWVEGPKIFQYSSVGSLPGYSHNLDLDISYMSPDEWVEWTTPYKKGAYSKPVADNPTAIDTSNYPITKYGHKNAWVRLLQNALTVRGFSCTADGVFGKLTFEQVKMFQWSRGLTIDGVVGPFTWKALFS